MSTVESGGGMPMVVAVIDIGSNSARMEIAQVGPEADVEVLEQTQRAVRLGHDTFVSGRLSQQTMNAVIAILRDYRKLLETYGVETVRAVATSAVREAGNGDAFVDRVAMAVDIDVEVLAPAEESRLTVSAVRRAGRGALDLSQGRTLIANIGGGNTLLTMLEDGEIAASESWALGSVRLQEHVASTRVPQAREADILRRQIANAVDVIKRAVPVAGVERLVAVGEDAVFPGREVGRPLGSAEPGWLVGADGFEKLVASCSRHRPEELARRYSLPFASAERLVPALLIGQGLVEATGVDELVVCDVSMRDGLLQDLARRVMGVEDEGLAESILQSARTIGEKYRHDARHAEHVAALAVRLFDELQTDHRLTPRHRLLLRVAAIVHEVGKFVSNRAHHKHSHYLISNSEVFGLRRDELAVVADVARYHRRASPRPTHLEYITLPREDRVVVNKLAGLLRVADALERGHAQQVREFRIERRPAELVIYVHGVADLTVERGAIAEKANLFEDTYGMRVRLEEVATPRSETRRARPLG